MGHTVVFDHREVRSGIPDALAAAGIALLPVSSVGARRLLEHFGSLRAVFSADERELREVPGIGPVRGAALGRLFSEYERG